MSRLLGRKVGSQTIQTSRAVQGRLPSTSSQPFPPKRRKWGAMEKTHTAQAMGLSRSPLEMGRGQGLWMQSQSSLQLSWEPRREHSLPALHKSLNNIVHKTEFHSVELSLVSVLGQCWILEHFRFWIWERM